MTRPGWFAWFGAFLVWTGAAVMSFSGLDGLARTCFIAPTIAWLLPIVIDVGVAVAAWVWRRGVNPDAARLAGRITWSLLVLTVVGNGAHLGMEASHITPPWWVAAVVGAIPPAVAGATAHLLVLLGRSQVVPMPDTKRRPESPRAASGAGGRPPGLSASEAPKPAKPKRTRVSADPDSLLQQTRELAPIGRRALSRELGVSEHQARTLLESVR